MTRVEYQRQVKLRLSILNHYLNESRNASSTCRRYGISRKTFYKWISRYKELGEVGLSDQSKRPKNSPRQTFSTARGSLHLPEI